MLRGAGRATVLWIERLLAGFGLAVLLYCGTVAVQARSSKKAADALVSRPDSGTRSASEVKDPKVLGTVEIRELGVSAPIISGVHNGDLLRGVGHMPGTALPGGLGTMGLAGHRDTFFRALEGVKPAMEVRVAAVDGVYRYSVDSTEIVSPEHVEVVATRDRPELALITCYPFHFVGAAPERFIVHAHLLSVDGEAH